MLLRQGLKDFGTGISTFYRAASDALLGDQMNKILVGAVALISTLIAPAFGHSGGLNSQGCHNNRKTGDYHCHRSASPPANDYDRGRSTPESNRNVEGLAIKMSRSGICHAPGTTYYARTQNFMSYPSIGACVAAGGRLPQR